MTLAAFLERAAVDRESWRYTSLKPLAAVEFRAACDFAPPVIDRLPSVTRDTAERHRLVFVDGALRRDLGLLTSLTDDLVRQDGNGYVLTLGGQTCLATSPLELIFVSSAQDVPVTSATPIALNIGANSRLTLIEHHITLGTGSAPHVATHHTMIALGEQSKLIHAKVQGMGDAHTHLAMTRVNVARGAFYDGFVLSKGAALSRHEAHIHLAGEQAQADFNSLSLLRGAQHADITSLIDHGHPHGTSRQIHKCVADGKARGVFQGKIIVREGAQKTDGQQTSRALMLSDQTEINSKPELEIYADDVKCSHGATVGQIEDGALFYLRARGVPETAARAMLVRAFLDELIDDHSVAAFRDFAHAETAAWLGEAP